MGIEQIYRRSVSWGLDRCPTLTRKGILAGFDLYSRVTPFWSSKTLDAVREPVSLMGLQFVNPIGVAAGLDRHGRIGRRFGRLGFGHVEIGTLTPRAEPGHNRGLSVLQSLTPISELDSKVDRTVLGVNIGKNRDTPMTPCEGEFLAGLTAAWPVADYVVINLSGAATAPLLMRENRVLLTQVLGALKDRQRSLAKKSARDVALLVKVELLPSDFPRDLLDLFRQLSLDGLIVAVKGLPDTRSTQELQQYQQCLRVLQFQEQSCRQLADINDYLKRQLPLISVGGIQSVSDLRMRQAAGASLVQFHRALLQDGPRLLTEIHRDFMAEKSASDVEDPRNSV